MPKVLSLRWSVATIVLLLFPATPAHAQHGLSLRGWLQGLPAAGIAFPRPTPIGATLLVPVERGTSVSSVAVVFPASTFGARTADVSETVPTTRLFNGQLIELHVLIENGQTTVRVVRDVATLQVTGVVTAIRDEAGLPVGAVQNPTSDCPDPRDCIGGGQKGSVTLDLGAASSHSSVTLDTGLGSVFSTVVVGCQYSVEAAAVGSRLFAARIDVVGRLSGDFCHLTPAGSAPHGLAVRGWMSGLPATGEALPPLSPTGASVAIPVNRGTSFVPLPVNFPVGLLGVRTADAALLPGDKLTARVRNGLALDLLLLPDGPAANAWIVRDVATLRLKGMVTDARNAAGEPVDGAGPLPFGRPCEDPRVCVQPLTAPGQLTFDLGPGFGPTTVDVGYTSFVPIAVCKNREASAEVVVTGGRLFAVRIDGTCPITF
jgi:hypothetical protein